MTEIRKAPCVTCPYRRDVPSGVWHESEYEKLREYDADTSCQPVEPFMCHTGPESYCHGWALVHGPYDLLALRLAGIRNKWDGNIPEVATPLFDSGSEAADHGQLDIERPKAAAEKAIRNLIHKRQIQKET